MAGTVTLVTGEWNPFTSQDLKEYGFFTQIVSAVFKEMGVSVHYKFYPWPRCEHLVKNGKVFAAFPYSPTPEREKNFIFSAATALSTSKFFYFKDKMKSLQWKTLNDLKSYKIGGVLGYYYMEDFLKANLDVDMAPRETLSLKKLYIGRVDLVPLNELVGWQLIEELFPNEIGKFGTNDNPLRKSSLHLMALKANPESIRLIDQYNSALKAIQKKGIYSAILREYNLVP